MTTAPPAPPANTSGGAVASRMCAKCQQALPLTAFGKVPYGDGLNTRCKVCRYEVQKVYQRSPAGKATQRRAKLMWLYGITQAQYDAQLEIQGGVCAICKSADPRGRSDVFSVDHDHETGAVRGLLCLPCNNSLGWLETHTEAAAGYLAQPPWRAHR